MKRLFFIFLFVFVTFLNYAQVISEMHGKEQKRTNWCWAACVEMIIKKHSTILNIQQCKLVELYRNKIKFDPIMGTVNCVNCDICNPTPSTDNCNKTIVDTFFRRILDSLNFQSIYTNGTINALSWLSLSQQMNQGLPLIMTIKWGNGSCTSNHAVVAYGIDSVTSMIEYKNPKNPYNTTICESITERIIYTIPFSLNIIPKVCRFFYNIKPKPIQGLVARNIAMESNKKETILLDTISFEGAIKKNLNKQEFLLYSNSINYIRLPVKYVSSSKILENTVNVSNLKKILLEDVVYDFIYTKSPFTVTSLQEINNKWIPITISFFQRTTSFYSTFINDKKIFLSKKAPGYTQGSLLFDGIVKYPEMGYSFMQIKKGGISYLIPLGNYSDLKVGDSPVKSGLLYKEALILNEIQNITRSDIVQGLQNPNTDKTNNKSK